MPKTFSFLSVIFKLTISLNGYLPLLFFNSDSAPTLPLLVCYFKLVRQIHFNPTTIIFFLCVSTFLWSMHCFPSLFFYNILKQETEIKSINFLLFLQVDLRHMCEIEGSNVVDLGIDLSEMYLSVEWDILEVPAVR